MNATITSVANERGAALVDANGTLKRLATTGINVGGVTYNSSFLTGGVFSYDGVHPTAFGYAYIANLFIDAINAKFGGHIPRRTSSRSSSAPSRSAASTCCRRRAS
jgi:hypothetical protein